MQRKNYFLRTSKNGMAMIMALTVIVTIGTIMALSLSLTTQTTKRTTDLYLYEQSVLLSQSAAEYALLRLSQVPPCSLSSIPGFRYNNIYDINISMQYISVLGTPCQNNALLVGADFINTTTPDSNGSVIMDITVQTVPSTSTEPIRYFKRTIQKL